ncbi:21146_t:CDS:1, partial [Gigaspora rosea]
ATVSLEHQRPDVIIDPYVKSYIDKSIRASTTSVVNSIKQYIDSQSDRQRSWNKQLQSNITNINNILAKIMQSDNSHSTTPHASSSSSHAALSQHPLRSTDTPLPYTTKQASWDIQTT